jgi:hypothetical protein
VTGFYLLPVVVVVIRICIGMLIWLLVLAVLFGVAEYAGRSLNVL